MHTWLFKVKSHVGIKGNEVADAAAKAATGGQALAKWKQKTSLHDSKVIIHYGGMFITLPPLWPHIREQPTNKTKRSTFRPLRNCQKELKGAAEALQLTKKQTLYGPGLRRDATECAPTRPIYR